MFDWITLPIVLGFIVGVGGVLLLRAYIKADKESGSPSPRLRPPVKGSDGYGFGPLGGRTLGERLTLEQQYNQMIAEANYQITRKALEKTDKKKQEEEH